METMLYPLENYQTIMFPFGAKYPVPRWWGTHHNGIDFRAPNGTHVRNSKSGEAIRIGVDKDGYGLFVVIRCDDGTYIVYAHLERVFVQVGDRLPCGAILGTSGNSGSAEYVPHLHLELRMSRWKSQIDPAPYLRTYCANSPAPPTPDPQPPEPRPPVPEEHLQVLQLPSEIVVATAVDALRVRSYPQVGQTELDRLPLGTELAIRAIHGPQVWGQHEDGWSALMYYNGEKLVSEQ